ncbi:hypothetical protein OEZ85_005391 [Tetradesmus obliquus]|uniref:Uncharacterized protein n=1 Tax=Tetradesmus obliquus TaxID=3088 RepID=A0ABY8UHV1_TETOB|nr:hypothetical protein OEZ85_005391 [Tetradesmus obliquus]
MISVANVSRHARVICSSSAAGVATLPASDTLLQCLLLEAGRALLRRTRCASVAGCPTLTDHAAARGTAAAEEALAEAVYNIRLALLQLSRAAFEAAVEAPGLPAALQQHPHRAAALLEAGLRATLAEQHDTQSREDATYSLGVLCFACNMTQHLQGHFGAVCRAQPAAAEQLFGLAASMLKAASQVCSSSFADKLGFSSSTYREVVLESAISSADAAVHAIVQQAEFPAAQRLLLLGRLLSVLDGSDAAEKTLAVAVRSCRRSLAALCEHAFGAVMQPQLPAAIRQHPCEAAALLEAALKNKLV